MKKLFCALLLAALACGCTRMLPAHDVEIYETCADEIAVLQDAKLRPNSPEKYKAAKSIIKKIDFSYTKDFDFVASVFNPRDMRSDKPGATEQMVIFYYQDGDKYVAISFKLYGRTVTHSEVKIQE